MKSEPPTPGNEAFTASIYKGKGSDSDPANYRPISLLNTFYKLYAAMLRQTLLASHDDHLWTTQYGFGARRSTSDPLFILRRALDLSIRTGTPLCLLFLDWKMALDKVDHKAMSIALQRLGVHRHYIDIITDLYSIRGITGNKLQLPRGKDVRSAPISSSWLCPDVNKGLLASGIPTNTWSVSKPVYDLE